MYPIDPFDFTKLILQAALSKNDSDRQLKEKEIEERIQERRTYLAELRIEERMHRVNAQKEVLLELKKLAQHTFDRKMDYYFMASQQYAETFVEEMAYLKQKEEELSDKQWSGKLTAIERVQVAKRLEKIQNEQHELRLRYDLMALDFNQRVSDVRAEIQLSNGNLLSLPRL